MAYRRLCCEGNADISTVNTALHLVQQSRRQTILLSIESTLLFVVMEIAVYVEVRIR